MSSSPSIFLENLIKAFPFEPNTGQMELLGLMAQFISDPYPNATFVMKGYAGTGKTTMVVAVVEALKKIYVKSVLLAPTGRAAKVMSSYSGKTAFTIHKYIYAPRRMPDGSTRYAVRNNNAKNTLFIVDESSMISDKGVASTYHNSSLLDDLITFVSYGQNCRLLLIGDIAQLPPIGMLLSAALDVQILTHRYDRRVYHYELQEVLRQKADSGILRNATHLRSLLFQDETPWGCVNLETAPDVQRLSDGYDIENALYSALSEDDEENTIILTYSNRRANLFNQQIRSRIKLQENEIATGDLLMVVKNNYFWLPDNHNAGFIANGDTLEVLNVRGYQELYGFRFAEVEVRMVDYPNDEPLELNIILDTLSAPGPSLSQEQQNQFYEEVALDYEDAPTKAQRVAQIKENPYFNALQVKFANAVTCHKAQGGQWKHVFIEQAWLPEEKIDKNYLRWLYTAFTRATERVYLLGFTDEFFKES